jgi:hypothetical protein
MMATRLFGGPATAGAPAAAAPQLQSPAPQYCCSSSSSTSSTAALPRARGYLSFMHARRPPAYEVIPCPTTPWRGGTKSYGIPRHGTLLWWLCMLQLAHRVAAYTSFATVDMYQKIASDAGTNDHHFGSSVASIGDLNATGTLT